MKLGRNDPCLCGSGAKYKKCCMVSQSKSERVKPELPPFITCNDCGGKAPQSTFTILDTTVPTIDTEASDATVECDGSGNQSELDAWLASNGGASASDVCSNVTWENDFNGLSDECGSTGEATVTFTATDDCGNATTTAATFIIEDNTPPTIDPMAADAIVECDGHGNVDELQAWLTSNAGASAVDQCGEVTWSNDYNKKGRL